jgi:hypothetical protein
VREASGAYHLVSSIPVTVYQFNALEYRSAGGPPGKDWSTCPGDQICPDDGVPAGCFSFSNDASLLLPTAALTGNYRITAQTGDSSWGMRPYFAVTGTEDGTEVSLRVSDAGEIAAGGGLLAIGAGQLTKFSLGRGEVVQIMGTPNGDIAGSLVQADKPVQVMVGVQ